MISKYLTSICLKTIKILNKQKNQTLATELKKLASKYSTTSYEDFWW